MTKRTIDALGNLIDTGPTSEAVTTLDELISALEEYRKLKGDMDVVFKKLDDGTVTLIASDVAAYCCEAAEVVPTSDLPPISAFD
ncbi:MULTISPECIES: hypothetical protein [unclassified Agarivorans]|uniref:hypothetical protein n=1 Tax=unclassified Agarivorans TaxID=2636026 RepID=UPI0026E2F661|nr:MULTISPECIES: hypothetical protein [unclassified Agarivorans]MDO6684601.1 hypothetical protein [Agarivorans sp. 3_MG-2023]MDO6714766.1 hypothetical protein [Agarivorans sp. 2_MG-2023]